MVDLSSYRGEWIVMCEGEILGHNTSLKALYGIIKSCKATPEVMMVPPKGSMYF